VKFIKALIWPELDDLLTGFYRLEAKTKAVLERHLNHHSELQEAKRFIEADIAGVEHEIQRVKTFLSNLKR
jgi:predicted  nucleic acid-binding Zn-ribbon protein